MKLKKAIEIQTIHNDHNPKYTDAERQEAHKLGIEALKDLAKYRKEHTAGSIPLLPGETE